MVLDSQDPLLAELDQAQRQLELLDRQLQHKPDFGLGVGSPEIVIWEMNLARRSSILERIAEIEQAIERRSAGSYGICEVCGTAIDQERLRILPHTTYCIRCAGMPRDRRARTRARVS